LTKPLCKYQRCTIYRKIKDVYISCQFYSRCCCSNSVSDKMEEVLDSTGILIPRFLPSLVESPAVSILIGYTTSVYFNSHSVLVKFPVLISPSPLKKPTILFRTDKFPVELVLYATDPRKVTFPSCVTLSVPMRL
jgi:hypothetical protein